MEIFIKDPIHNFIKFSGKRDKIFIDLINSKEFQRLRRIMQLGVLFIVYPTAEHSRFIHSIGTFEVARKMFNHFYDSGYIKESDYNQLYVPLLSAALLHDIGHGPFSHVFELLSGIAHEDITKEIIIGNTEVNEILTSYDKSLSEEMLKIFTYKHPKAYINSMISSQLDADRLDYITRDSYNTGVGFGTIDVNRIINILKIKDEEFGIIEKGIGAIENYLLARHQMFWEVYYHKTGLILARMLKNLISRAIDLFTDNPSNIEIPDNLSFLIDKKYFNLQSFLEIDDTDMWNWFKKLSYHKDEILSDLATRILYRKLFKAIKNPSIKDKHTIKKLLKENAYDLRYYYTESSPYKTIYEYGKRGKQFSDKKEIYVFLKNGKTKKLSEYSQIIKDIQPSYNKSYVFVPDNIKNLVTIQYQK